MFSRYMRLSIAAFSLLFATSLVAMAQSGELRGHALIAQADGQKVPASEAAVDVYRTDLPGKYNTKTNKKGEFVFAGLPYVGDYLVIVSHPSAQPTWLPKIKAGRNVDYEFVMSPGDGKRPTLDEVKAAMAKSGESATPTSGGGSESASDRAKREELLKKNAEIEAANKKITDANAIIARTFKAGNEALSVKNYDEAIRQYDEGLAADPEQPALLTNKANALKSRGVDRYNTAITATDDAAKTSGLNAAKADFTAAKDAVSKAVDLLKSQGGTSPGGPADAQEEQRRTQNKLAAMSVRAEVMRLYVTKADQTQVDAGMAAYDEYLAIETDPVRKAKAEKSAAQMLFDANAFDKALDRYQKILASNPDDLEALLRSGQALFNIGAMNNDKAKYQEAANYLAKYVEKAPDTDSLKADAKAILETLKAQENVKPEKGTGAPARRRKP
jgi:tetratricopeptide (TPR) repeat protein